VADRGHGKYNSGVCSMLGNAANSSRDISTASETNLIREIALLGTVVTVVEQDVSSSSTSSQSLEAIGETGAADSGGNSDELKTVCKAFVREIIVASQKLGKDNTKLTAADFKVRAQHVSYTLAMEDKAATAIPLLAEMGISGHQECATVAQNMELALTPQNQKKLKNDPSLRIALFSARTKQWTSDAINNFNNRSTPEARAKNTALNTAAKAQRRRVVRAADKERNQICSVCHERFARSVSLQIHITAIHGRR
jgi:hypothetical protein